MLVHNTRPGARGTRNHVVDDTNSSSKVCTLRCKIFRRDPAVSKDGTHQLTLVHYAVFPSPGREQAVVPVLEVRSNTSSLGIKRPVRHFILGFCVWARLLVPLNAGESGMDSNCWGGVTGQVRLFPQSSRKRSAGGRAGKVGLSECHQSKTPGSVSPHSQRNALQSKITLLF